LSPSATVRPTPGGAGSQLPPKSPLQHRREEGVELFCRPGLASLEPFDLGLELIEAGDDAALLFERRKRSIRRM